MYGHDMNCAFVYHCTDCIEACAAVSSCPNLNQTCYGVAVDIDYDLTSGGQYGDCFLKKSAAFPLRVANINLVHPCDGLTTRLEMSIYRGCYG